MVETKIKLTGFELLELLGEGGMGAVWKARQLSLDRLVAVKLLLPQVGQDPESIQQIMTEARTAARLKHPGIVQVYDASEENGHYFFVMEYVDGYSVGQWLVRSKVLPWKEALVVVESVALALEYAWQTAGLIHCDIKPENIMVDRDGTIKVADMGLSRTRESRDYQDMTDIVGTPAYMSPEQVRGDVSLDCRTDIYALGATLYQMVTGRRLFLGKSDKEVLDCVLTDQVHDPRDIVQGLPATLCALLERMLAKNRNLRIPDWSTVISEIRRVEKGQMPTSKPLPAGASTVNCRKIVVREAVRQAAAAEPVKRSNRASLMVLLTLLAAAGGFVWYSARHQSADGRTVSPGAGPSNAAPRATGVVTSGAAPASVATSAAQQALEAARRLAAYPRQYRVAARRFQEIARNYPGTPEATQALAAFRELSGRMDAEKEDALRQLTDQAKLLEDRGQLAEAVTLVETYTGPWAGDLAEPRQMMLQGLRQKLAAQTVLAAEDTQWDLWLGDVAQAVLESRLGTAQQAVGTAVANETFKSHRQDLDALSELLKAAGQLGERILQSFQNDIGKTVHIRLGRGELDVSIMGIAGNRIMAQTAPGRADMSFGWEDLAPAERLARLGSDERPEVALVKGMTAMEAKDPAQAEAWFARTVPVLSRVLLTRLKGQTASSASDGADAALASILTQAGIPVSAYDEAAWIAAIRAAPLSREQAVLLATRRDRFLQEFGAREFVVRAAPVLLVLDEVCQRAMENKQPSVPPSPTVATNATDVPPSAGMDQAYVVSVLKTRNPALLNEQVLLFEESNGKGLQITSDAILDLTPLAKLRGFRELRLVSTSSRRLPLDVRPLVGTDVEVLKLGGYMIKDLSALQQLRLRGLAMPGAVYASYASLSGLQLVELDLTGSSIRDLSPLRGMKLETLVLDDTKINNLTPLSGMPLRRLSARGVPLHDVGLLRPMPLETLNLAQTMVFDFQPLRGLGLRVLDLRGTQVREVSFCASMPLTELDLSDSQVSDLSGLKGKSLVRLALARTPVRDLAPLEGASIQTLDLTGVRLPHRTLAQTLGRISCGILILDETAVTDLAFLAGSRLQALSLRNTRVSDLSPLRSMPLRELNFQGTPVADYSPLETLRLNSLWVNGEWRTSVPLLASLPELGMINGVAIPEAPAGALPPGKRHMPHDIVKTIRDSGAP